MTQGSGSYQRIGVQITAKGIHSKGFLHNNSTKMVYVRHAIGWYKTSDAVGSTMALFQGDSGDSITPAAIAAPVYSLYTSWYKPYFTPIYDKTYALEGFDSTTGGNRNCKFFNVFRKLNKKVKFSANASSTETKPRLIEIFFVATADNDDGTGYVVELSQTAKVYFTDS